MSDRPSADQNSAAEKPNEVVDGHPVVMLEPRGQILILCSSNPSAHTRRWGHLNIDIDDEGKVCMVEIIDTERLDHECRELKANKRIVL